MDYLNHCRLCLEKIPDPVTAANVFTKLSDGVPLAEHLDTLFDILVRSYIFIFSVSQAIEDNDR